MSRRLTVLVSALAIFLAGCAAHSARRAEVRANESAGRDSAEHWLQLLDQGDYAEAFEYEAQDFRMRQSQTGFIRSMQARRAPFGQTIGRKFIGAANLHKMVGLPEGNYESVLFKTAFEKKSETAERVILVQQSVGWRVVDYRIY